VFHKILKSGCKRGIEAQDRPAPGQPSLGLLHPELAGLLDDDAQSFGSGRVATLALTENEIAVLDRLVSDKTPSSGKLLAHYLTKIARLGGYLARANDPPPGNPSCGAGYHG